jgi:hypothetical protein
MCKREHSAKFDKAYPITPYSNENGQFGPLLVIECRGLEFTGFNPQVTFDHDTTMNHEAKQRTHQGVWKCRGVESGTLFADIEFPDREWTDYDEKVRSCSREQLFRGQTVDMYPGCATSWHC